MEKLCKTEGSFSLGRGKCNPRIGFATAFILSKERKVLDLNKDIKTQIQAWLNDGSAMMLTGMDERSGNNTDANVHSFSSGKKVKIADAIMSDNFDFATDFCLQKLLAKLVDEWGEGFHFVTTTKRQLLGDTVSGQESLRMSQISFDAMSPAGLTSDNSNAQVDTLTVTYGSMGEIIESRGIVGIDFTPLDLTQARPLELSGNLSAIRLREGCLREFIPSIDPSELEIVVARVNSADRDADISAGSTSGVVSVAFDPSPITGQDVELQIAWKQGGNLVGMSKLWAFTV
jgi:hypothetical protein